MYIYAYMHICIHTYIHTYIHTHTHTHTRIHTHTHILTHRHTHNFSFDGYLVILFTLSISEIKLLCDYKFHINIIMYLFIVLVIRSD